jgi:hypothetical protein
MRRLNPLRNGTGNLIRDSRELFPGFGPEQGISLKTDPLAEGSPTPKGHLRADPHAANCREFARPD